MPYSSANGKLEYCSSASKRHPHWIEIEREAPVGISGFEGLEGNKDASQRYFVVEGMECCYLKKSLQRVFEIDMYIEISYL